MKKLLNFLVIPFFMLIIILSSCEKGTGPLGSGLVFLANNFDTKLNYDTCYWKDLHISFIFDGTLIFLNNNDIYFTPSHGFYIKKMEIYTINDYNDKYKANSDISEIFDIYLIPIIDYAKRYKTSSDDDFIFISNVTDFKNGKLNYLNCLILNTPPSFDGEQRFIIEIDNGAGKIIRDTTKKVYLKVN